MILRWTLVIILAVLLACGGNLLCFGLERDIQRVHDLSPSSLPLHRPQTAFADHWPIARQEDETTRKDRADTSVVIKVMSYNLNHISRGNDNDPRNDPHFPPGASEATKFCLSLSALFRDWQRVERNLEEIIALVECEDPDILFLQEVDRGVPESFWWDTAEIIARKGGYPYGVWGAKWSMDWGLKYVTGNAILSKYPLLDAQNIPLNALSWRYPHRKLFGVHTLLAVTVDIADTRIRLMNTHLYSKKRGYAKKVEQLEKLFDLVQRSPHPVIVGGDFNTSIARLKSHKPAAADPTLPLLRASNLLDMRGVFDDQTLDFIFLRKGDPGRYVCHYKIPPVATDHSIIVSILEFPLEQSPADLRLGVATGLRGRRSGTGTASLPSPGYGLSSSQFHRFFR